MAKETVYTDPNLIYVALSKPHSDYHCQCESCVVAIDARNKVVQRMHGLIYGMAIKHHYTYHRDADDFYSVGIEKVLKEFHHFKPELKISPLTYFGKLAWQAMSDYAARDKVIRQPPRYSKRPTTEFQRQQTQNVVSLDGMINVDSEGLPVSDADADSRNSVVDTKTGEPSDNVSEEETRELVNRAISKLPSRLREIINWRVRGKTMDEIAGFMKITKERVRQLEAKAMGRMRAYIVQIQWRKS